VTKYLAAGSRTIDEVVARMEAAAAEARAMRAAGVRVDPAGVANDCPCLTTDDLRVPQRFGFDPPEEEGDD
jgi:hypothetical protein